MDIGEFFNRKEFSCRGNMCCSGSSPMNQDLIDGLDELRRRIGAIYVTSGFRCLTHNRNIGSNDTSQHPLGTASDIWSKYLTPSEIAEVAEEIPIFKNGGIGIYNDFVHVDVRKTGPARW